YVRESVDEHQQAMSRHMRLITQFHFSLTLMNATLLVTTAAIGIWLWAHGQIGAGVVATALPLAWQVSNVSGWVSWEVTGIFENIGVVQEGMQSIAVPHSGADRAGARALQVSRGDVRFEHVTFGYGRRDAPPVLNDMSMHIRAGERVGLVGRSGAGKTTLVNLLLRFHDVLGQRGGSGDPGRAARADARKDGDRHRSPALHHLAHGSPHRARGRPHRRARHPRRAAAPGRPLREALAPPVGRLYCKRAAG